MNAFTALFIARTKEFYRDRGQLIWSLVFPVLVIAGCAMAFSNEHENLFTIGVYQSADNASPPPLTLLNYEYNRVVYYEDFDKALNRVRHHQIHLLVNSEPPYQYWVNPQSSQGQVLEQLLQNEHTLQFEKREVSGRQIRYVDWVLPGVLAMNIMFSSLFGVGFVIVRYRKNGVLKRLHATPLSAMQFLSAQVISRILIVLTTSTIIYTGAHFSLDLLMLGSYVNLFIIGALGAIALISLGLLMSTRTDSEELASGMLNASTWPMLFLSDVFFSLDDAPVYMQQLAQCLPLTHLVQAARDIMINGADLAAVSDHALALLLMTVVFLSLASVLFRWHR